MRRPVGWLGTVLLGAGAGIALACAGTLLVPAALSVAPRTAEVAWISQGRPSGEAQRLLELLRTASVEGLEPDRYATGAIVRALADPAAGESLSRADALLTASARAYVRDLTVPRSAANVTYVDDELRPTTLAVADLLDAERGAGAVDRHFARNPIYRGLRDGLRWYRARWSHLPQVRIPRGEALRPGSEGERVRLLRRRLGVPGSPVFDDALGQAVREFREVHGLRSSLIADDATIGALNRGAKHYERLIAANLDRARGLSAGGEKYVVVDAAGARLHMIEAGREVDAMRVIVGKRGMETPELAGFVRFAIVNPYWNVPPDLVRQAIAPAVVRAGPEYLAQRRFVLFSSWQPEAISMDPYEVDWDAVAAGRQGVWVRQLPGGDNMMGEVKFMLPNRLGIYLHDTPRKDDFARSDRRLSSGCVRVADARRLARWFFGRSDPMATAGGATERRVDLPRPVPVFITYLTALPEGGTVRFQPDVYGRDPALLERLAADSQGAASS